MAQGHPIAAGLFVALMLGGIGKVTMGAMQAQKAAAEKAVADAEARHKRLIVDGVARGQAGDYEGAVVVLAAALKSKPHDHDAAYNLGVALGALGRNDDAEKVLSALLAEAPQDWSAAAELAAIYDAKGDGERAIQILEKVPAGEGEVVDRFKDTERWGTVRAHARFEALRSKHGIATVTATAAEPPQDVAVPEVSP